MFRESSRRAIVYKNQWPEMVSIRSATPGGGSMCCCQNFTNYLSRPSPHPCFPARNERRSARGHCRTARAVLESDTSDNFRQLIFTLQPPPGLRGGDDQLEYHQLGSRGRQRTSRPHCPVANCREHAFNGIGRPQVIPVLGGEVVEGQHCSAILRQAFDRLVVLRSVFLGEDIDRHLGRSSVRGQVNFAQVLLHVCLHRQRDLVQYVRRLVHPTPLVPCSWKDLVDGLPEAEPTVANSDFRGDLQPAPLHLDQQLTPALGALASANLEADELLLALRRRADQHQHAFGVVFHPGLQVDTVRPDIHVSPCRQVALLPAVVLVLPLGRQSGNHRRRQVRRFLAQERRQRLLEVARRDAAQIKRWQQRIQALRPPSPFWQDRREKADPVALNRGTTIPDFHRADLNRSDPCLDRALGTVTMPDDAVAAVRQLEILHGGKERPGLHLDSLRKQLPGAGSKDICQGIVDLVRLTKPDNTAILIHGVSLSLRGSGRLDTRLDTPPISYRHHPASRLAPLRSSFHLGRERLSRQAAGAITWPEAAVRALRIPRGRCKPNWNERPAIGAFTQR